MSPLVFLCVFLIFETTISTLTAVGNDTSTVYEVLQQYDFPVGILPIGVIDYELNTTTGKFSVSLNETCTFSIDGYNLRYKSTITGVISNDTIKNLKGISVKIVLFWLNIVKVVRDDDDLEFSVGIASADFPVSNFEESPQCGCGFDCDGVEKRENGNFNCTGFVSSS